MPISAETRRKLRVSIGHHAAADEILAAVDGATVDPIGVKRYKVAFVADLASLNAKYVHLVTIPSGFSIKKVALTILETVVAGGTTVKIAAGQHGGDVDAYGLSADLAVDSGVNALIPETTGFLAADTDIDLCGVVTNGSALGDTNISAGMVFVVVVWDQP